MSWLNPNYIACKSAIKNKDSSLALDAFLLVSEEHHLSKCDTIFTTLLKVTIDLCTYPTYELYELHEHISRLFEWLNLSNMDSLSFGEVSSLIDIICLYLTDNIDKDLSLAAFLIQKVEELFKSCKNPGTITSLLCEFLLLKGKFLRMTGNYDEAIHFVTQSLELAEKVDNNENRMEIFFQLSFIHYSKGNRTGCHEYAHKYLDLAQKDPELKTTGKILYQISLTNTFINEYAQAEIYSKQSIAYYLVHGNYAELGQSYNSLASLYRLMENYSQAQHYYEQALDYYSRVQHDYGKLTLLYNLGAVYYVLGDFTQSLSRYRESLELARKQNNINYIIDNLLEIGEIYYQRGELAESLKCYEECQSFKQKQNQFLIDGYPSSINEVILKTQIAAIYRLQGNLNQAIDLYLSCITAFHKFGRKDLLHNVNFHLGSIYQDQNNYDEALAKYLECLDYFVSKGNDYETSEILYQLVILLVDKNEKKAIITYLNQLEAIYTKNHTLLLIECRFFTAKAYFLKTTNRIIQQAKAQKLFLHVCQSNIDDLVIFTFSIFNLCELLILELKSTRNEDIFNELHEYANKLALFGEKNNSPVIKAQAYLLQAQIALLEFKMDASEVFLSQAVKIAEKESLIVIRNKINVDFNLKALTLFRSIFLSQNTDITLSNTQISILIHLNIQKSFKFDTLYKTLTLSKSTASRSIMKLEELELVKTHTTLDDARVKIVSLTDLGSQLMKLFDFINIKITISNLKK